MKENGHEGQSAMNENGTDMDTSIIHSRELSKRYGKFTAVDGLSLAVPAGSIYGFVGPNGAGKTTTMRMLTTLTRPSRGEAWVAGHSIHHQRRDVRRAIGYMPDEFGVYDDLRVWEYLDFFAACYDIPESERRPLVSDLLELVDLAHRRDDMVDQLSRGMKQRLSLARTLAHDPQVLILDEPASGLDPRARVEIRELLVTLASMGKTVFFSTHILADVSEICSHIGIIEAGKMIIQGSMADIRAELMAHREIIVTLADAETASRAHALLRSAPTVLDAEIIAPRGGRHQLRVKSEGDDEAIGALNQRLVTGEILVLGFTEETRNLETMFMRITRGVVT